MNIKQKFLELTSRTYPHGTEEDLIHLLPNNLSKDQFGNLFCIIGDKPKTMFTCHLDTASHDCVNVKHVIEGNIITTDGTSILGADDKAGVVILMNMIESSVTGLYYFFLGEERGCIGSKKLSSYLDKNPIYDINKVISFDRRGYDSVITHQLGGRCCSNEFASQLSDRLNNISKELFGESFKYVPDSTGIYTDSAQFTSLFSECTNISVGYYAEHTRSEQQDIEHLERLSQVVVKIDWESIETHRNPKDNKYSWDEDEYFDYGFGYSGYSSNKYEPKKDLSPKSNNKTVTIFDELFNGKESTITYDTTTYEIKEVELNSERLHYEKSKIEGLLNSLEVDFDSIKWDGNYCTIYQNHCQDVILNRNEIEQYLTNFNDWIQTEIKYNLLS